jgi:hypothetical protein
MCYTRWGPDPSTGDRLSVTLLKGFFENSVVITNFLVHLYPLVILHVQRTCLLMLKILDYISLKHFFNNQASTIYVD